MRWNRDGGDLKECNLMFINWRMILMNVMCVGPLPHSCDDGSRLWIDWRDITVFDGIHSIPEVKSTLNHHYTQNEMFYLTSHLFSL